jgi:predicted transcriptional regulator
MLEVTAGKPVRVSKRRIMYNAMLSYAQLGRYLSLLIESDLVQDDRTTQTFRITEKDNRFLKLDNRR